MIGVRCDMLIRYFDVVAFNHLPLPNSERAANACDGGKALDPGVTSTRVRFVQGGFKRKRVTYRVLVRPADMGLQGLPCGL